MKKEMLEQLYSNIPRENKRAHAILLFKKGYKISQIAEIFFIDEDTARSWKRQWKNLGRLKDAQRKGASKIISFEIEQRICQIVDENKPEEHGMPITAWDCKELKIWLKKKFNVDISEERIRQILKNKQVLLLVFR